MTDDDLKEYHEHSKNSNIEIFAMEKIIRA